MLSSLTGVLFLGGQAPGCLKEEGQCLPRVQSEQPEVPGLTGCRDMGFVVSPLFWEGEPLVHTQDTLLPLTLGTSWTSSALWPQDMGLRPLLCLLAPGAPIRDMEGTPQG